MWILTAIFQAIGQAVTWIFPISENGHSSIFHDFSARFTGSCSQLTGIIHIGIAVGLIVAFYKLFFVLLKSFIAGWSDLFSKRLDIKKTNGSRKFMYLTLVAYVPMLLLLIPAGKYTNLYGLLRYTTYNKTLLDDGIFFAILGGLILLALSRMNKHLNNKSIELPHAIVLGIVGALSMGVSGFSVIGVVFCLAVAMGIAKKPAFRFSIALSVPVLLGVGITELVTAVTNAHIIGGVIAFIIAGVSSYFLGKLLLWFVNNAKLKFFAYYDFSLGAICAVIGIFELLLR